MKIRQLLLLLFSALVLFPALTIGAWTYNQSSKTRFDEVREHHLLLAKNLGETLEKYYLDTKLIFEQNTQFVVGAHMLKLKLRGSYLQIRNIGCSNLQIPIIRTSKNSTYQVHRFVENQ